MTDNVNKLQARVKELEEELSGYTHIIRMQSKEVKKLRTRLEAAEKGERQAEELFAAQSKDYDSLRTAAEGMAKALLTVASFAPRRLDTIQPHEIRYAVNTAMEALTNYQRVTGGV